MRSRSWKQKNFAISEVYRSTTCCQKSHPDAAQFLAACSGARLPPPQKLRGDGREDRITASACSTDYGGSRGNINRNELSFDASDFRGILHTYLSPITMTDSDIRNRSISLLSTSLAGGLEAAGNASATPSQSQLDQAAIQIEAALFTAHQESTSNEYRNATRERSLMLKKDNPQLAAQLLSGSLSFQDFATQPASSLRSSDQKKADEVLEAENIQSSMGISSNFAEGDLVEATRPVELEGARGGDAFVSGQSGLAEAMLGEEGEFKARGQPKVGKAMEGELKGEQGFDREIENADMLTAY